MRYLTIDGMRSGTGIRDAVAGGYVQPSDLGLSAALQERISRWVARCAEAHARQYDGPAEVEALDADGLAIARLVSALLPGSKVDCFSDAKMITLLP